jgi:hypothetical protein
MEDRQSWRSVLGVVLPLPEHAAAYDLYILVSWVAAVRARIEELTGPKHRSPEFLGVRERIYIASMVYQSGARSWRKINLDGVALQNAIVGRLDALGVAANKLTRMATGLDALVGDGVDLLEDVISYVAADRIEFNPEPLWAIQRTLGKYEERPVQRYGSLLEYIVDPPEMDLVWRPRLP